MLTESVHVRLTANEKAIAKRLARLHRRTTSNWIRKLILEEFARERDRRNLNAAQE